MPGLLPQRVAGALWRTAVRHVSLPPPPPPSRPPPPPPPEQPPPPPQQTLLPESSLRSSPPESVMSEKREFSPGGPSRGTKRTYRRGPSTADFISLSQTPPSSPSPPASPTHNFGDFIFIDTTPTPIPDAFAPPKLRPRPTPTPAPRDEKKVEVDAPANDPDVTLLYQGLRRTASTRVFRRSMHTHTPMAPALDNAESEVQVLETAADTTRSTEVEVVLIDQDEEQQQQQQQRDEVGVEGEDEGEADVLEVSSDSEGDGGGKGVGEGEHTDASDDSEGGGDDSVVVDTSGNDFVSLGPTRVSAGGSQPPVEVSDLVLERRRRMEATRPWVPTELGHRLSQCGMSEGAVQMTVVSYNVLAQSLLQANPYLYRGCSAPHLSWDYRWSLLQHEVLCLHPDVLLLQEVDAAHYYSHYLPWFMGLGYVGLFKKRTGCKTDGCAIFFHGEFWRLVEQCSVEYQQPSAPEVLNRDNVGLIARLQSRQNGEMVCVATTHLLYNPRRHDVKLAQTVLLLAELDRLCYTGQVRGTVQYCPILLAGDLNAEPHSALLSFLRDGKLRYEGLARRTLTPYSSTSGPELEEELLPPALGITANCQHAALAQGRWLENQQGPIIRSENRRGLEEALIRLHHSDRPSLQQQQPNISLPMHMDGIPQGCLSHNLLLRSVFGGQRGHRGPGVTTFQERWVCVDYLFYSQSRQPKGGVREGQLRLLERLVLPSATQAQRFSPLPSDICPSDHFPLAAKFMLQQ